MIEADRERDRAAERVADQHRLVELQRVDERGDRAGLREHVRLRTRAAQRAAGTRPVDEDHAMLLREPRERQVREIAQLPREPVDEHDRRPVAVFDVVDAVAADVDEAPFGRKRASRGGPRSR